MSRPQHSYVLAGEGALIASLVSGIAAVYVAVSLSPWPQPARALGRSWRALRGAAAGGGAAVPTRLRP
jgi:hypothetical protein